MPDRIVRAGILTSEAVNALGWKAEVFYRRLMSVADDFGRYDGRSELLRAMLYPLKLGTVSASDVSSCIAECERAGLVRTYTVNGRGYIEILKFEQRLRATVSKWPSADGCQQVTANDRHKLSNASESEAYSDSKTETDICRAKEVLNYLNERAGTKFQPVDASLRLIKARLKEGASVNDCKLVVDDRIKAWSSDLKMRQYIRPQTLFNAEKFSGYLGRSEVTQKDEFKTYTF